ncbi:hypothetical protein, partial [Bacillus cereus group sp. BC22]|uniref:hypothetical protein n=1 Tax=Bacillus cereus group sp. BC22 TaxID=3445341 RepID=UPI003F69D72A
MTDSICGQIKKPHLRPSFARLILHIKYFAQKKSNLGALAATMVMAADWIGLCFRSLLKMKLFLSLSIK